jgi:RNA polymerase sigma factor (sigma-70 family)
MAETKIIHTDQRFVHGLLHNDTVVVRDIYDRFSGKVKGYILQNSGSEDDAADIFQEALIDIYQQAQNKALQLTCPFEPFLLLICKRKWLNELKKRGRRGVTKDPDDVYDLGEDVFALAEQMRSQEDKAQLFMAMFRQLGERCKEVISKCLGSKAQDEVAAELGVSYAYLRKKKSECTAELIKLIKTKQVSGNESV